MLPRPKLAPLPAALLCTALCAALAGPAAGRCVDEDAVETAVPETSSSSAPMAPVEPRGALAGLVKDTLERSHAVGATRLLAEAALQDIDEARAARGVQASLGAGIGPGGSRDRGITESAALQLRANINISQLLWDGGRSERLVDWRTQLADSARWGHLTQQEQLALTAVALQLERSRNRMTAQVWRQHVRKTACLVEALETIVRADRGRASELVQAQKTLQQAELQLVQTQSSVRQIEVRLRRLVGDGLPGTDGLSTVFLGVPELPQLVADVERSAEIAQYDAQERAARRYAEAVAAGQKPQVSWNLSGNVMASAGNRSNAAVPEGGSGADAARRNGSYSLGLSVNVPLISPGQGAATGAARLRAEAARLQRAEALESRRFRVAEVHEQATAAAERARRLAEVLKNSEQVRSFTLQQWQQLGKRSLFDVMAAEADHYSMRIAYVNALHDVQQLNANLLTLGRGVIEWLR